MCRIFDAAVHREVPGSLAPGTRPPSGLVGIWMSFRQDDRRPVSCACKSVRYRTDMAAVFPDDPNSAGQSQRT